MGIARGQSLLRVTSLTSSSTWNSRTSTKPEKAYIYCTTKRKEKKIIIIGLDPNFQFFSVNFDESLWWFLPIITEWLRKILNKHFVVIIFARNAIHSNTYGKSLRSDMSCWLRHPLWMGLILRELKVRTNTPEKKFFAQVCCASFLLFSYYTILPIGSCSSTSPSHSWRVLSAMFGIKSVECVFLSCSHLLVVPRVSHPLSKNIP